MINRIVSKCKKYIIKMYSIVFRYKLSRKLKKIREKYGNCILFIAVPTHGNLGDQAIVYSQYKIFEDMGLKDRIIEIKSQNYIRFSDIIRSEINHNDMIVIDGGGNMGTLWIHEEYKMRDIIKKFKENKIIIFPETVFYSDDELGKIELNKSKEIYNSHNNLNICVRDKRSYNLLKKEYYNANIVYTPDIVLYLDNININRKREGAIFCIRDDKEQSVVKENIRTMEDIIRNKGININYSSTVIKDKVYKKDRESKLMDKWTEFSSSQIVITDRLHGMIFSAITSTPCIALNNCNGKVEGVYSWIKNLPYIIFCNDIKNINKHIDKLIDGEYYKYNNKELKLGFDEIKKIIAS